MKPIRPDPAGELVYLVPWIEGPNGWNRPFGLDTRYGHLIFVFIQESSLYDSFFQSSVELLKPGFQLKKAAVVVPRQERLAPELAANMPNGIRFAVLVEGTEVFDRYMQELAEDTIWGDTNIG